MTNEHLNSAVICSADRAKGAGKANHFLSDLDSQFRAPLLTYFMKAFMIGLRRKV